MKVVVSTNCILKDKTTEVDIYYSPNLFHCNATSLILRSYAELLDSNLAIGNSLGFGNDTHAMWAENNNSPVGGICFTVRQELLQVWINFSFTDLKWKGMGINSICHSHLEGFMKKHGLTNIASHVNVNNTSRIRSCEKVGLKPTFYRMEKFI